MLVCTYYLIRRVRKENELGLDLWRIWAKWSTLGPLSTSTFEAKTKCFHSGLTFQTYYKNMLSIILTLCTSVSAIVVGVISLGIFQILGLAAIFALLFTSCRLTICPLHVIYHLNRYLLVLLKWMKCFKIPLDCNSSFHGSWKVTKLLHETEVKVALTQLEKGK